MASRIRLPRLDGSNRVPNEDPKKLSSFYPLVVVPLSRIQLKSIRRPSTTNSPPKTLTKEEKNKFIDITPRINVKLPSVEFRRRRQRKTSNQDPITLPRSESAVAMLSSKDEIEINQSQIERSIRFLQEEHRVNLSALHQEIEALRRENRDLQFQLVFGKDAGCNSSSAILGDSVSRFMKSKIEILERDIRELQESLEGTKNENDNLKKIIETQKLHLESLLERDKKKINVSEAETQVDISSGSPNDFVILVKISKAVVQLVRCEYADRETKIATIKTSLKSNEN